MIIQIQIPDIVVKVAINLANIQSVNDLEEYIKLASKYTEPIDVTNAMTQQATESNTTEELNNYLVGLTMFAGLAVGKSNQN